MELHPMKKTSAVIAFLVLFARSYRQNSVGGWAFFVVKKAQPLGSLPTINFNLYLVTSSELALLQQRHFRRWSSASNVKHFWRQECFIPQRHLCRCGPPSAKPP
jgi:hypothetical protein